MFSHHELWKGIDLLARRAGLSPSALAKRAGLDPTAFNLSKRITTQNKERWLSTETLSKVLKVTEISLLEFSQLARGKPVISSTILDQVFFAEDLSPEESSEACFIEEMEKYSIAERTCTDLRSLEKYKPDPFYIFRVSGSSANSIYAEGQEILVSVFSPISSGNHIFLKEKDTESHHIFRVMQVTDQELIIETLEKSGQRLQVETKEILWKARILWSHME